MTENKERKDTERDKHQDSDKQLKEQHHHQEQSQHQHQHHHQPQHHQPHQDLSSQQQQQQRSKPTTDKDDTTLGTQKVYKKASANSQLILYLPTREIILCGTNPTIVKGVVFLDNPKLTPDNRVFAQLTLTFRYGREDEEVMGLRFCNEAIMSLHQVWPTRNEDLLSRDSLTPLQEALLKRLGDGCYPFTLSLQPQAPPSVQLVPAKRYYGAPIGTSYDIRCFVADKTDDKLYRRANVRMGVRVIFRTDILNAARPENFATLVNNQLSPPPVPPSGPEPLSCLRNKRTSDKIDSFSKIRLSPKTFRFSGRFGRSKSEVERCSSEPYHNYSSKSFHDQHEVSGGPHGEVDKPFLLQDGKVGLRASLDKSWYTHGEDVVVTINIKNDSRKTVRKVRVCAIQHVDVCMFNNGKFKNVVAESEIISPGERTVSPGSSLSSTIILKPKRGTTKNWIALEDTLQRSTDPEDITGVIAASAIRTQHPTVLNLPEAMVLNDERNVFAIYVSYYVKVKLTLSGIGGELSLKLPFALVHIDQLETASAATVASDAATTTDINNKILCETFSSNLLLDPPKNRTQLATLDDANAITKRKLVRSSTTIKDSSEDEDIEVPIPTPQTKTKALSKSVSSDSEVEMMSSGTSGGNQLTCVQIHNYPSLNLAKSRKDEGEAFGIQETDLEKEEDDKDNELRKHS